MTSPVSSKYQQQLNTMSQFFRPFTFGYVTDYQITEDNNGRKYKVMLNSIKCDNITGCQKISAEKIMYGVENNFGLVSPNNENQLIIMSQDNKYIFFNDSILLTGPSLYWVIYNIIKYGCKIPLVTNYFMLVMLIRSAPSAPDADQHPNSEYQYKAIYYAKNPTKDILEYNSDPNVWLDLYYILKIVEERNILNSIEPPESFCYNLGSNLDPSLSYGPSVSSSGGTSSIVLDCRVRPNAEQKINIVYTEEDNFDPRIIEIRNKLNKQNTPISTPISSPNSTNQQINQDVNKDDNEDDNEVTVTVQNYKNLIKTNFIAIIGSFAVGAFVTYMLMKNNKDN